MKLRSLMLGLIGVLFFANTAYADCPGTNGGYYPLTCEGGMPCPGTQLLNEGNACQFTGIQYMFSTIMCQFISMVNVIMAKFYCAIQGAMMPVVGALIVTYIVITGVQFLTATAQFNSKELVTRILKLSIVFWLVNDPTRGVSAGVALMFDFFIGFIADTTSWVIQVLDATTGGHITGGNPNDVGTTSTFRFIDNLIFSSFSGSSAPALTGLNPQDNAKVIGFFVSLVFANPSLLGWVISFFLSVFLVFLRTLIAFLIAVISISFLMGLSPIFISFMLFNVTFQYFDMWLRFMISYCLQVMVTFAILAMYIYSLSLFSPFFKNLSEIVFPYQTVQVRAPSIWGARSNYGVCELAPLQFYDGKVVARCASARIVSPMEVQKMVPLIFFLFYNMISLVLISFGFHTLQKNTGSIARQLAGPAFVPIINSKASSNNTFSALRGAGEHSRGFMPGMNGGKMFSGFNRRHDTKAGGAGIRNYASQMGGLLGRRS